MMRLAFITVGLLLGLSGSVRADEITASFPGGDWEHVDAERIGWSADKLKAAETWSHRIDSSAVMIVHHGAVVAEWGDTAAKTPLASARKSLLSALIGNAVARGEIKLDQTLGQLGIDDNEPSLSEEEKTATVRDLLQARSGVYHAALFESPDMAAKRPPRRSHKPGTFWYYNNWDANALGTIYEKAAHSSIFDAFAREIAWPVEMQDYQPADGKYVTGAASLHRAYPFDFSARDLARFALLYLHKGKWRDRQIVPTEWVEESTRPYSEADFTTGYGYLWWIGGSSPRFLSMVNLPEGTFLAAGYGGQYAYVIPAFDLVIVHRAPEPVSGSGVSFRDFGRLLWLLLDAGHFADIGPDRSIEAAVGTRLDGAALREFLPGKTLVYAERASDGPYRLRFNPDGSATMSHRQEAALLDTGTWRIDGDQLCRDWGKIRPQHLCFSVVNDGRRISLFDQTGLMVADTHLSGE